MTTTTRNDPPLCPDCLRGGTWPVARKEPCPKCNVAPAALTTDELLDLTPDDPAFGSRWRHRKGGTYRVLCVALEEATRRPVVVYQADGTGLCWTRPHAEFTDGRFTPVEGNADG